MPPPRRRAGRGPATSLALLLALAALHAAPAAAQQPALPDSNAFRVPPGTPSPAGAMLRSLVVPGWGQAASRAYFRGGIYFAAVTGSWIMVFKTNDNLASARTVESIRRAFARDSILAAAETDRALASRIKDPLGFRQAVDSTDAVAAEHRLADSRRGQRQDWIAQVIFWTLAGAADAYVTNQLVDFPVDVRAAPRAGGGVEFGIGVPWKGPR